MPFYTLRFNRLRGRVLDDDSPAPTMQPLAIETPQYLCAHADIDAVTYEGGGRQTKPFPDWTEKGGPCLYRTESA